MARTKTKPGPKSKYGEREEIHVLIPKTELDYIKSRSSNITEWVIQAIQEKREDQNEQLLAFVKRYRELSDFDQQAKDEIDQNVDAWLQENGIE